MDTSLLFGFGGTCVALLSVENIYDKLRSLHFLLREKELPEENMEPETEEVSA